MFYKNREMNIKEYFKTRMQEAGFMDEHGCDTGYDRIGGLYRDETEYNIIGEYASSCGLETKEEQDFAEEMGYSTKDFFPEDYEYDDK